MRATVPPMAEPALKVALITDVFPRPEDDLRLLDRLAEAKRRGAALAVLPELPLDPWVPARPTPDDGDAEPPEGARHARLAAAAGSAGIAVLGGAIVRDPESGGRRNRALLLDAGGRLLGRYDKNHLPFEEGFWEAAHYEPGDRPPEVLPGLGLRLGVQICSDAYRPDGTLLLRALGAEVLLVPRATPPETWWRWQLMLRTDALVGASWLVSVNRPAGEPGTLIGGPSVVVAPDGRIVLETTEPVAVLELDREAVAAARRQYPGDLAVRPELYARGWNAVTASS